MTTYSVTLNVSGSDLSTPTIVTQNITASDNILATITTPTVAFDYWDVIDYVGCTPSSFTGARNGTVTITPTSGATSYYIDFETSRWSEQIQEYVYRYGRIQGTVSGGASDTTPDAFTFTDQTNVALSTTITSNTITVSGINAAASISITGGNYSINGGAYTSSSGTVTNGQTVTVQHTSSASYSTATNTTLTIGGVSDTFTSTTLALVSDTTPDAFTFTDQTGVALNTTITSNTITVSGINAAASISITGGTYSINGGAYTSATGTVTNGQTVSVRHTSSASNSTATNTTLTIGGISDTFTSTTLSATTYTLTFYDSSFTQKTTFNEGESLYVFISTTAPNGTYYWNTSSDADLVAPVNGSFLIDAGFGSIYCTLASDSTTEGTETLTFNIRSGSVSGTILASSSITVLDTSTAPASPTYSVGNASTNEGASATVNVTTTNVANGTTLYWTVNATTADVSTTSGSFTINSNAGSFTIPAIADSTTEGTETYTISVRTGSTSGTVVATSTLTINDTSTTPAGPDTTPDAFSFTDLTNVGLSSVITSNTITVSGISAAATISVSGGTYSINGGAYTGSTGSVSNGQTVTVQHTSSASYSTATNTILTIGGVSDTFTSTTIASGSIDTTPDAFSFTDVTNASLNVYYTNNVLVSGLQPNYSITVTATGGTVDAAAAAGSLSGTYSASKTVTSSATGTIVVSARALSGSSPGVTTNCVVTIGGVSDTFSVTTYAAGTRPDQFTFTDQTNVALNTLITSNSITVSGMTAGTTATVSLSGSTGGRAYSKNGGAFVTTSTTVTNGDTLRVQLTSSPYYNESFSVSLLLTGSGGTTIDSFSIKTPEFLYFMTPYYMNLYEGSNMSITAKSTQTINGTLYWTIDGGTTADFNAVSGTVAMTNGSGTFTIGVKTDAVVEGTETYTLSLRTGSTAGTVVATSTLKVTDPPASSNYGFQLFDELGNIVLNTNDYTIKDTKYSVEVSSATTLSVPSINNNTIAQVIPLSGSDTENTIEAVSIDYTNKLLSITGSGFLAEVILLDYR